MLKVGDKVRVIEGLKRFRNSKVGINEDMLQFEEEIVTINGVEEWGDILIYSIKEDEEEYYWVEEMFEKIEEKESNNMKELTFREVIANIKEGEVWENDTERIIGLGFGGIKIEWLKGDRDVINLNFGYTIKRPQYTFQEAFKAFEEGKEIESCESGFKYEIYEDATKIKRKDYKTIYEHKAVKIFSTEEIKGKWYIND